MVLTAAALASRVLLLAFAGIGIFGFTCGDAAGEPRAPRVKKVLPHFLDLDGKHARSPSLYERDAYQAFLRRNKQLRSGLRLDVQLRGTPPAGTRLRIELRGQFEGGRTETKLEDTLEIRPKANWRKLVLKGEDYAQFGELVAWRATLWRDEILLSEHKSFLW